MQKIYIYDKETKKDIEYQGGITFLNGKRSCPECSTAMERTPLGQPFVRRKGGKILVDISQVNGKLHVAKNETDYMWTCTGHNCGKAISTAKAKFPVSS